jgi:RNA polymerase sigma factor (sigma-70 family)
MSCVHVTELAWPRYGGGATPSPAGALVVWPTRSVPPAVFAAAVDRDTEAAFRRGERAALLSVYEAHAGAVRAVVGRFFARPFEREEAAQEVWLLVQRMAPTFDPARGALLPWLRAVAANRCKELLRAQGRRPDPRVELAEDDLVAATDPEQQTRDARVKQAVEGFSASLSGDEALVFRLSLIEERGHEEAAAAAGITVRRCKYLRMKLLLRAAADATLRQALREVIEP